MIGPMLTSVVVTSLIILLFWRVQFYALGILAVILPLSITIFLLRGTPGEHPAVNAAERSLIQAGTIETNEDAPGRIFAHPGEELDQQLQLMACGCRNLL